MFCLCIFAQKTTDGWGEVGPALMSDSNMNAHGQLYLADAASVFVARR